QVRPPVEHLILVPTQPEPHRTRMGAFVHGGVEDSPYRFPETTGCRFRFCIPLLPEPGPMDDEAQRAEDRQLVKLSLPVGRMGRPDAPMLHELRQTAPPRIRFRSAADESVALLPHPFGSRDRERLGTSVQSELDVRL